MAIKKKNMKLNTGMWLVMLPAFAATLLYLIFVFTPSQRRIAALRSELARKRAFLASAPSLQAAIKVVEAEISQVQDYSQAIEQRMPRSGDLATVYEAINLRVKRARLQTTHFEPHEAQPLETVKPVSVALRTSGSFARSYSMLHALEKLPEIVWIENLQLESTRADGEGIALQARLVVFVDKFENSD